MSLKRLLRLADIMAPKYGFSKFADDLGPVPIPEKRFKDIKDNVIDILYKPFFSEDMRRILYNKRGGMAALFLLEEAGEPATKELFRVVHQLVTDLDNLDTNELYSRLIEISDYVSDMSKSGVINYALDHVTPKVDATVWNQIRAEDRRYIQLGLPTRLQGIKRNVDKLLKSLQQYVSKELIERQVSEDIDISAKTLKRTLINRFLMSETAKKHFIFRKYWDMLYNEQKNPELHRKLTELVNRWNRSDPTKSSIYDAELAAEVRSMIEPLLEHQTTNIPYLEQGEVEAPSTSTSVPSERTSLFDPKTDVFPPDPGFLSSERERKARELARLKALREAERIGFEEEGDATGGSQSNL